MSFSNPQLGSAIVGGGGSVPSDPVGAYLLPSRGQWVIGTDKSGKAYLFKQGSRGPGGVLADFRGLQKWYTLPADVGSGTFGTALSDALGWLKVNANQSATIIQSVDAGAIMQGGNYVAVGTDQQPGQTLPNQGQSSSGSEATSAGINLPGVNLPSLTGLFGNLSLWKGVGLVLAGVLILVFAALELKKAV